MPTSDLVIHITKGFWVERARTLDRERFWSSIMCCLRIRYVYDSFDPHNTKKVTKNPQVLLRKPGVCFLEIASRHVWYGSQSTCNCSLRSLRTLQIDARRVRVVPAGTQESGERELLAPSRRVQRPYSHASLATARVSLCAAKSHDCVSMALPEHRLVD
jgi:hypothetical protein